MMVTTPPGAQRFSWRSLEPMPVIRGTAGMPSVRLWSLAILLRILG